MVVLVAAGILQSHAGGGTAAAALACDGPATVLDAGGLDLFDGGLRAAAAGGGGGGPSTSIQEIQLVC